MGRTKYLFITRSISDLLLQAARECQVLLKNNDSLLPLSSKQKIAVIGPNANHYLNQLGYILLSKQK